MNLKHLPLAIRQTLPRPSHGLARVETTIRQIEGVEQVEDTDGTRPEHYRWVLSDPKPFVAVVSVL